MDWIQLQLEVGEWARRNFGGNPAIYPLLGAVEEMGELSHAVLKGLQGIRGTKEEHDAKAKDAVGDIIIYLADFCERSGYSLNDCIENAWDEVKERDWRKNRDNGQTNTETGGLDE